MTIASTRREIERFGWGSALSALGWRALDRGGGVHVLLAIGLERVSADLWQPPPGFDHGFLDAGQLRSFARDPDNHLAEDFFEDAIAHGDVCYGLVAGSVLASFGWYSRRPTPIEHGLVFHVGAGQVYKYNSYTRPEHRGQRLHGIGAMRALDAFHTEGATGLVGYIDGANLTSQKSWRRMGCVDLGSVYVHGSGDHSLLHLDARCRKSGLRIERGPAEPSAATDRMAA